MQDTPAVTVLAVPNFFYTAQRRTSFAPLLSMFIATASSNHPPIQHRIKLAQLSQRSVQDVEPRHPPEVEDSEEVILLRDVFRAADCGMG